MSRARTVKVTVYSCRNLKPKKGDGDPLAWVLFGFGKQKCCTGQIRDRNAKWNEESTFTITDPKLPLKFTVKDKDDTLGQVIVPVSDLPSDEHFLKWVPIGPHRKNPNPSGELCLDCWVDEFCDESDGFKEKAALKPTKMAKFKSKLRGKNGDGVSPNLSEDRKHAYGLGVTSIKGSVSVEDISATNRMAKSKFASSLSANTQSNSLVPPPPDMQRSVSAVGLGLADQRRTSPAREDFTVAASLPVIREQAYPPKVMGIVPTSGPCTGGTLIQITGKNLGLAKEDISRLMVAGCNCLPSLEYYTPNKIMCTTTESEGIGPISITTKSGGTSSSKMMFEFVPPPRDVDDERVDDSNPDSGRCSGTSETDREKDELIEDLKYQVQRVTTQNRDLREYIDKLVCYLMDKYPDALESSKMYR